MNSIQAQIESSNNQIRPSNLQNQNDLQQQIQAIKIVNINHHGFSSCPTFYQVLPLMYALLMLAQFMVIVLQFQNKVSKIALILSYLCIICVLSTFWFITTLTDPTDTIQILHKEAIQNKNPFNSSLYKYFCHICQTCVSKNSFHCRKCNRCVDMFDHHCKWVNNCIGAKNYLQFLGLVISSQVMILFHFIFNSIQIAVQSKYFPDFHLIFYFQLFFICVDFIILCLNSILLVMHLYLVIKKKTTLQLILDRRKENKIHPSFQVNNQKKQTSGSNQQEFSSPGSQQIGNKKIKLSNIDSKSEKKKIKLIYSLRNKIKSIMIQKNNYQN